MASKFQRDYLTRIERLNAEIQFVYRVKGNHLIIGKGENQIQYWAKSERFFERSTETLGHGFAAFIQFLESRGFQTLSAESENEERLRAEIIQ